MVDVKNISTTVLDKIKEYACLRYNVSNEIELKAAIVDERFTEIINIYYSEVMERILRQKADQVKNYIPTDVEFTEKFQEKIDSSI